jgi:hypothetical protein
VDTHNAFVPPVFVIQIQIPSDPPSGFFTSAEDGPGWAILMYYRISEVRPVRGKLMPECACKESLNSLLCCLHHLISLHSFFFRVAGRCEPAEGPEHRLPRREALRRVVREVHRGPTLARQIQGKLSRVCCTT